MPAPLVSNPSAIFLIVLGIILMAPVLLARLKIPHIISMIVAGIIVGPYGFNILADDSSFTIFGHVGLLYLMFLAGIEIDMYHLKLNLRRGLGFGLLTWLIPLGLGTISSIYILQLDALTSLLLGAMYSAHTLIAYPVVARFGVSKAPSVLIAIVGTIIAVIGSLLVLGGVLNVQRLGYFEINGIALLLLKLAVYCVAVFHIYPRITRRFFKMFADPVSQYIFVMALVFLSSFTAEVIGLESVLGAFFAGLVLNRFVPPSSPLMSRIEFVGNAVFIPYFLIGVGMMINIKVIMQGDTLAVAGIMLTVALLTKWLAAWGAQKLYKFNGNDRRMMFGLTVAHTAVALAVVTIGYNTILPNGERMMDETVLNGTILVILISCAIAPIVTSQSASRIKIKMMEDSLEQSSGNDTKISHRTLIPVANPVTARPLVELALLMRPPKEGHNDALYAMHVRNDNSASSKAIGRNSLDLAKQAASDANRPLEMIERYDLNTVTGVVNAIEERDINEIHIGLHRRLNMVDSFLGSKIEQMLKLTNKMLVISRLYIPVNTIGRIIVMIPQKAQFESGFPRWVASLGNLARETGARIIFCCPDEMRPTINGVLRNYRFGIRSEYRTMENLDDFVLMANRIKEDDLLVIVSARASSLSYSDELGEVPGFLQKHFQQHNIVMIYPEQFGDSPMIESFADPLSSDITTTAAPWFRRLRSRFHRRSRSSSPLDL